jgi:hypothetical protein
MTEENVRPDRQHRLADRPLRLISTIPGTTPPAVPPPPLSSPSPALRRLQLDLEAARAEARNLRDILEELPAILERKFQQRLRVLLAEQLQLEHENSYLHHHLWVVLGGHGKDIDAQAALPSALCPPQPQPELDETKDAPITAGLGLRRALRHLYLES